jgi:ABC-type uncharacterized transport system substrate-binding protein
MSNRELADKYLARQGLSIVGLSVTDFFDIMESISVATKGFFLFKIDGERSSRIYTFVVNISSLKGAVIRMDTDSVTEGIEYVLSELERNAVSI